MRRWLLGSLVVALSGAVWLNGPGLRWLGPMAVRHFLPKAGFTGDLAIEGNLSHGFSISNLSLESAGPLARLTLARATPQYRWADVVRGKFGGLSLDGLHATIRLDAPSAPEDASDGKSRKPFNPDDLPALLAPVREKFLPLELDLNDITVTALKNDRTVCSLASTRISHAAGSGDIVLRLGAVTDATGKGWPAQTATLSWLADRVIIDHLDIHPALGLANATLLLPQGGRPSFGTGLRLDEATFGLETSPGFADATLDLRSGILRPEHAAAEFGVAIPAAAGLSSFSLSVKGLLPDPLAATARLDLGLENISFRDWSARSAKIGLAVGPERAVLALDALALGTPLRLDATLDLARSAKTIAPGAVAGSFKVPAVPALVSELAKRFPAIRKPSATPDSALSGIFAADLSGNRLHTATLEATLAPADPALATPLSLTALYDGEKPLAADVTLDGLKLAATFQPATRQYQGRLDLDGFSTARLGGWLAVLDIKLPGSGTVSANWSGSGDLVAGTHSGTLELASARWQPDPVDPGKSVPPPVTAKAKLDYAWPDSIRIASCEAETRDQTITLSGGMAANTLTLDSLRWQNAGAEVASGTASLPLPADLKNWRDLFNTDIRPAAADIRTQTLPLGLLQPWLPPGTKLDSNSTARLSLKLAGSYSKPRLHLDLDCLKLRAPDQPKLPPGDLRINIETANEKATVHAMFTAEGYAPAVLAASMPCRPAAWVADPALVGNETFNASLELPKLELSRFTTLVPALSKLSGTVTGHVTAAGSLRAPDARGVIRLDNAAATFAKPDLPPIDGAGFEINFTPAAVTLARLRAGVAGGSLTGSGSLALKDYKPASLDFRLRGDHLPLLRNDMMIVRANADLRVAGPWQTAAITGTVGVTESLFYRDIELLPIGKPFTTPSAAALPKLDARTASGGSARRGIPAPFDAWTLNVAVRTQDPFLIRGNLASGRVDVDLRVLGTPGDPKPDGVVTLANLTATLPFSTLKIEHGTVRFTPASGFDPILEIRGAAEPRPYQVEAYVYGKASDPQMMLTSSPPLPETEIMTLLATGTTTSGLEDKGAAANRAVQLFAEEVRRGRVRYTKQLRPLLGLFDRVDFSLKESDPYSPGSLSTATISLTDRWFLSAGMGADGNTRLMGIWRVSFK